MPKTKPFLVQCNKCGSNEVSFTSDSNQVIRLWCEKCDNTADEFEIGGDE